jgi:rhodanese-related sulfurtransferase
MSIEGVIKVTINTTAHTADVLFEDTAANVEEMRTALQNVGFSVDSDTELEVALTDLTSAEAKNMADICPELIILDVREESEFCQHGHIPASLDYPWDSGVLEEKYNELATDADILLVSGTGLTSKSAADFLVSQGFTSLYNITDGMQTWQWETAKCCIGFALQHVISALQATVQALPSEDDITPIYDVNQDSKIGLPEIICILKSIAEN